MTLCFLFLRVSGTQNNHSSCSPELCHQSQPDRPTWSCVGDTEELAVQTGGYSSPNLSSSSPNLLPQTPKENSSNGRVREATGVLVHSLASANSPNFSLSLIQTIFLVRSRQRLSHANQTWQHNDPNQGELKASRRKHFI